MKRILSLALAALLLTGCGSAGGPASVQEPSGGGQSDASGRTEPPGQAGSSGEEDKSQEAEVLLARIDRVLAQPVYPEFPQQPRLPEGFDEKEWNAYTAAYEKYTNAIRAIRGDRINLSNAERASLSSFAVRSVPLVLDGREGKNTVYSPLSLWSALALLAQSAQGDSRQQVLKVLDSGGMDKAQAAAAHIWRSLYTDDENSTLLLGNSVWLNSALEGNYVQETLDTLAEKYFAGVYAVPMGTPGADQAVTDWAKEQTNGLVGSGDPVVQTKPDTLALLASSLYYKAGWADKFQPEGTEEDVFTDAAGNESRVDFMHKTEDASFIRRNGYQAARLATSLGEMVLVLPDEGVTPESLLQKENFLSRLDFHGDAAIYGEVQWSVPKFDVSSDLDLKGTLTSLGITDLLVPEKADLSALTDLPAFLSDAKQLARVKVDEEGVEAAAVTILTERATGSPQPTEVCVMDLDRPFLFVIRTQDIPLFVGVVNQV